MISNRYDRLDAKKGNELDNGASEFLIENFTSVS